MILSHGNYINNKSQYSLYHLQSQHVLPMQCRTYDMIATGTRRASAVLQEPMSSPRGADTYAVVFAGLRSSRATTARHWSQVGNAEPEKGRDRVLGGGTVALADSSTTTRPYRLQSLQVVATGTTAKIAGRCWGRFGAMALHTRYSRNNMRAWMSKRVRWPHPCTGVGAGKAV